MRLYQHNKKCYNECMYVCAVILQRPTEEYRLMGSYVPSLWVGDVSVGGQVLMTFDLKGFCQLMDRSSSGDGSFAANWYTITYKSSNILFVCHIYFTFACGPVLCTYMCARYCDRHSAFPHLVPTSISTLLNSGTQSCLMYCNPTRQNRRTHMWTASVTRTPTWLTFSLIEVPSLYSD